MLTNTQKLILNSLYKLFKKQKTMENIYAENGSKREKGGRLTGGQQAGREVGSHTDRQTYIIQTDRQSAIQTDRHISYRLKDRQTGTQTDRHTDTQAHRHTDSQAGRQTGRQAVREKGNQTDRSTHAPTRTTTPHTHAD
jgi:hypothetical protein